MALAHLFAPEAIETPLTGLAELLQRGWVRLISMPGQKNAPLRPMSP